MNFKTLHLEYLERTTSEIIRSTDAHFIREKLNFILDHYQLINYEFHYDRAFWRARRCPTEDGFANTSDIGCPPIALTNSGRLNEAQNPILYTSINQPSTLVEIGAKEGDLIHVVAFEQIPNRAIRCGTIGEFSHIHRWGAGLTSEKVGKLLNEHMSKMPHDVGKSVIYTDAFLNSLLRDKDAKNNNYIHSRILASLIFSKNPGLDAIEYSGVALESSRNYAFKPSSAERALQIGAHFVLKITKKYKYGIYDFEVLRNAAGVEATGEIVW
ncbi:hypothetical protein [Pseudomonas shahriarae]|uniref:hypothetical protein n=1 Tax=Pseudomonas shahriarae TaxID=2745512 RepID=UPI0023606BDF|nr:hypothetical protein [Pseudomonas shahriarae]MDD0980670.1 hypothetical protein [Pseudomonas shahriarae]